MKRTREWVRLLSQVSGFLLILLLLAFMELACRKHWLDTVYFPAPSRIFSTLIHGFRSGELWKHTRATLLRAAIGYGLAMLIAVPVGLVMGGVRWIGSLLEPLVDLLRPMPSAAVIPVAILLFGIEDRMKIIVIIFGALWPTIISTVDGIRGVDSLLIDTGALLQLNGLQSLLRIKLPATLPAIFTGMRISLAIALILTVTAEMIAGSNGLGYYILDSERSFAFPEMFSGIVVVGMIGYVVSRLFVSIDYRILFWYYASRAGSRGER